MAEPNIERAVYTGPGKIITAKVGERLYPNVLACAGKNWMLISSLESDEPSFITGSSLISVFKKAFVPVTTNAFRSFLTIFGLSLQDLFDDSPEGTSAFIQKVCEELTDGIRTKSGVNPHTLRNLREWADSLISSSSQVLKKTLQDTATRLENLPADTPKSVPPVSKPSAAPATTIKPSTAPAVRALNALSGKPTPPKTLKR